VDEGKKLLANPALNDIALSHTDFQSVSKKGQELTLRLKSGVCAKARF